MYSDADVERLQLLRLATEGGRSIGRVVRLGHEQLVELVGGDVSARATAPRVAGPQGADSVAVEALELARNFDAPALETTLRRALAVLGVIAFVEDVAAVLLRLIGEEWHSGRLGTANEHLASSIVQEIVTSAMHDLAVTNGAPRVVTATPAGERHGIGAALVGAAAAAEGWNVVHLGADLPAADIAGAALAVEARMVALSIVYVPDAEALIGELRALRSALPSDIVVLAGGGGAESLEQDLKKLGVAVGSSLHGFRQHARSSATGRGRKSG
jgi:MerR family transcriptional regulator, light-induced transcriptional regulator